MYLIVEEVCVSIPGDERSRLSPGHGYGEHTETHKSVRIIQEKSELLTWLADHEKWSNTTPYKIYECTRELKVKKTIDFEFLDNLVSKIA